MAATTARLVDLGLVIAANAWNLRLFHAAQRAAIGYGFAVGRAAGFVTLTTYSLRLAATVCGYSREGHGQPKAASAASVVH
jgi:hypothetical protein